MSSDWSTFGLELLVEAVPGGGRRAALERAVRDAIINRRLAPGSRLPSSRTLARDLGWARGTVVEAYEQLAAEGYLQSRRGSPTRVARLSTVPVATISPAPGEAPFTHNLHPGLPDLSGFPRERWARALRRVLRSVPAGALGYSDPRGRPELRAALAAHLARTRGVVTSPERIVICAGWHQALGLLCEVLRSQGASAIAMEDPCVWLYPQLARSRGLEVVPLPVDDEGATTGALAESGASAAVITPAHQAPMGVVLSARRRAALVAWARHQGTVLIEDDYDCEYRYDRPPVGALQGLDPTLVVHAGTASKTLAPGLRLGWLTLPDSLIEPVVEAKRLADLGTSVLEQLALAELLERGEYDGHIRRMRIRYRRRRDLLLAALAETVPDVRVHGVAAGLHAVVELPRPGPCEEQVLSLARQRSIAVEGLNRFRHAPSPGDLQALVVGYAAPAPADYEAALRALVEMLREVIPGSR